MNPSTRRPGPRCLAERGNRRPRLPTPGRPRSTLVEPRVANAAMVMTYDRARVTARADKVTAETSAAIDHALAIHLGLDRPAP